MGPVVTAYEIEGSKERRVVIAYKQGGTTSFFSALSDLYHSCKLCWIVSVDAVGADPFVLPPPADELYSTRKYVGERSCSSLGY